MTYPLLTIADDDGFTLLETLIALVIMSLATAGLSLALPGLQERIDIRRAAAQLDELLVAARNKAQEGGSSSTVRFDPNTRSLELVSQKLSYRFPKEIELSIVGGAFGDDPEKPSIAFLSDGSSTGGVIELRSGVTKVTRRIGWLTGRIDKELVR